MTEVSKIIAAAGMAVALAHAVAAVSRRGELRRRVLPFRERGHLHWRIAPASGGPPESGRAENCRCGFLLDHRALGPELGLYLPAGHARELAALRPGAQVEVINSGRIGDTVSGSMARFQNEFSPTTPISSSGSWARMTWRGGDTRMASSNLSFPACGR